MTFATLLTLSRAALIPLILWCHRQGWDGACLALFIAASLTDFFDGRIARALGQETALGALLDPVADKAVELSFCYLFYIEGLLPGWFVSLVFARNVAQLASIPILMWMMRIRFKVRPHFLAKLGTAMGLLILVTCFALPFRPALKPALAIFIPLSAALEIYILVTYLPRFYQIAVGTHDTFE